MNFHIVLNLRFFLNKINKLQRKFLLKISKAYRTVSYVKLYILTGCTPIQSKIEELIKINELKLKYELKISNEECYKLKKPIVWYKKDVYKDEEKINETEKEIKEYENEESLVIYTDASKRNQAVACAIIIYRNEKILSTSVYKLFELCSVHQAELAAIQKALDLISNDYTIRNFKQVLIVILIKLRK